MTEIKRKNSEHRATPNGYLAFGITFALLCIPTVYMAMVTAMYLMGSSGTESYRNLINFAHYIGFSLPVIGIFSAIISTWCGIRILKLRDTFSVTLLTLVVTSGVLSVGF